MTTVLKLGGSVITDKTRDETVDADALGRAADAIAGAADDTLVLVHGGGSFGHPAAERHGLSRQTGTHELDAITEVTEAMGRLNEHVLGALRTRGAPAVRVQPLAMTVRTADGDIECSPLGVKQLRAEGFLPVLHGDLVSHAGVGCSVASGDELTVALGRALEAERLGFCSAVPGVLDPDGAVIERIDGTATGEVEFTDTDGTDVTGGMAAKVDSILASQIPANIFGMDDLPAFLAGNDPGTTVARD